MKLQRIKPYITDTRTGLTVSFEKNPDLKRLSELAEFHRKITHPRGNLNKRRAQ